MNGVNQIDLGPSGPVRAEGEDPEELGHSVHVSLQRGLCCHSYPNPCTSDSSLQKGLTLPPIPLAADHMRNPHAEEQGAASQLANTERQLITRETRGQRRPAHSSALTHPALKSQCPQNRCCHLLRSLSAQGAPGLLVLSLSFTLGSSSKKSLRIADFTSCPPLLHLRARP